MNEMDIVQRTRTIIEKLGRGKTEELPYCSKTMYWQINRFYTKSTEKSILRVMLGHHFGERRVAEHGHYAVQRLDAEIAVVYGNFAITDEENAGCTYSYPYEITVTMKNGIAERLTLTGNRDEPALCMVRCDEDHFYMLKESDILYIESSHNNIIWHCRDTQVRSRGTLKELESHLPEYFFRLQRAYIINTYYIKSLEKKEVTMDNGDSLLIPCRTYSEVKKQLKIFCKELGKMPERREERKDIKSRQNR